MMLPRRSMYLIIHKKIQKFENENSTYILNIFTTFFIYNIHLTALCIGHEYNSNDFTQFDKIVLFLILSNYHYLSLLIAIYK